MDGATSDVKQGGQEPRHHGPCTGAPKSKYRQPLVGTCYVHTVIDVHSRVGYVEAHYDETKETAAAVLPNTVA